MNSIEFNLLERISDQVNSLSSQMIVMQKVITEHEATISQQIISNSKAKHHNQSGMTYRPLTEPEKWAQRLTQGLAKIKYKDFRSRFAFRDELRSVFHEQGGVKAVNGRHDRSERSTHNFLASAASSEMQASKLLEELRIAGFHVVIQPLNQKTD